MKHQRRIGKKWDKEGQADNEGCKITVVQRSQMVMSTGGINSSSKLMVEDVRIFQGANSIPTVESSIVNFGGWEKMLRQGDGINNGSMIDFKNKDTKKSNLVAYSTASESSDYIIPGQGGESEVATSISISDTQSRSKKKGPGMLISSTSADRESSDEILLGESALSPGIGGSRGFETSIPSKAPAATKASSPSTVGEGRGPIGVKASLAINKEQEELNRWDEMQSRMVWFRRTPGLDPGLYLEAAGREIGNANITHINTGERSQIQIFLRRSVFAQKLLDVGIMIGPAWYKAYRGAEKPMKITIEGVPPCVPNAIIASALKEFGDCTEEDIESPNYVIKNSSFGHVGSCKRIAWVRAKLEAVEPEFIEFDYAGRHLRLDAYGGKPKCFKCGSPGHLRRGCPLLRLDNRTGNNLSMAQVVAGNNNTNNLKVKEKGGEKGLANPSIVTKSEIERSKLLESQIKQAKAEVEKTKIIPAVLKEKKENPLTKTIRVILEDLHANKSKVVENKKEQKESCSKKKDWSSEGEDSSDWKWSEPIPIKKKSGKGGLQIKSSSEEQLAEKGKKGNGKLDKEEWVKTKEKLKKDFLEKSQALEKRDKSIIKKAPIKKRQNALDFFQLTQAYEEGMKQKGKSEVFPDSTRYLFPEVTAKRLWVDEEDLIRSCPQFPFLVEFVNFLISPGAVPMDESGSSRKRRGVEAGLKDIEDKDEIENGEGGKKKQGSSIIRKVKIRSKGPVKGVKGSRSSKGF